jgi:hypothetical protein
MCFKVDIFPAEVTHPCKPTWAKSQRDPVSKTTQGAPA